MLAASMFRGTVLGASSAGTVLAMSSEAALHLGISGPLNITRLDASAYDRVWCPGSRAFTGGVYVSGNRPCHGSLCRPASDARRLPATMREDQLLGTSGRETALCQGVIMSGTAARSFVNFPSRSAAVSKTHRERRLMMFTQRQLFDVISDVDSYHEFVPWCRKSKVLRWLSDEQFEADLEVGFQVFSERYTSLVTLDKPQLVRSESRDSAIFHHLQFKWELQPGPVPSSTWVTFSTDFQFRNPLYTHTAGLFFDQVVRKMIMAFDQRCSKVYAMGPQHQSVRA